jgi:hypothetical protein
MSGTGKTGKVREKKNRKSPGQRGLIKSEKGRTGKI